MTLLLIFDHLEIYENNVALLRVTPSVTWTQTHYGTSFLRPSVYKVRVGGISLRREIEQIREGSIDSAAHSQSKQHLIGERFVPPTYIYIYISHKLLKNLESILFLIGYFKQFN